MPLLDAQSGRAGDAQETAQQVLDLMSNRLPLASGLRAMADDVTSQRRSRALREVADRLQRGDRLESALSGVKRQLPPALAQILTAAARHEQFSTVLIEYLHYRRRLESLLREARLACIYPVCVIVILAVTLGTILVQLGEPLVQLVEDFDIEPAISTRLFASFTAESRTIVLTSLGMALLLYVMWRFVLGAAERHRIVKRVPLLGTLWRWVGLAQWYKLLAMQLDLDTALPLALRTAADAVDDRDLAESTAAMADAVEQGAPLGVAAASSTAIPPSVPAMLLWAERSHQLPQTLHSLSELFEARARRQSWLIEIVLPAIVFLVVVWSCTHVMAAIMSPMINLIQVLT